MSEMHDEIPQQEPQRLVPRYVPNGGISSELWDEAVRGWIDAHIRNSPLAMHTDGWNHLMSSLPHLLHFINNHLKKE